MPEVASSPFSRTTAVTVIDDSQSDGVTVHIPPGDGAGNGGDADTGGCDGAGDGSSSIVRLVPKVPNTELNTAVLRRSAVSVARSVGGTTGSDATCGGGEGEIGVGGDGDADGGRNGDKAIAASVDARMLQIVRSRKAKCGKKRSQ